MNTNHVFRLYAETVTWDPLKKTSQRHRCENEITVLSLVCFQIHCDGLIAADISDSSEDDVQTWLHTIQNLFNIFS